MVVRSDLSDKELADKLTQYLDETSKAVRTRIQNRIRELSEEEPEYYELLKIFDLSSDKAALVDKYHNIGRFVFRNLGSIIEELTLICLEARVGGIRNKKIKNEISSSPSFFEIDWVFQRESYGYEIKWRYATTDGTTVNKIKEMATQLALAGYTPVFLTFFQPIRLQPLRCYNQIADHFRAVGGEVYTRDEAWAHFQELTGFDLKAFLATYSSPETIGS